MDKAMKHLLLVYLMRSRPINNSIQQPTLNRQAIVGAQIDIHIPYILTYVEPMKSEPQFFPYHSHSHYFPSLPRSTRLPRMGMYIKYKVRRVEYIRSCEANRHHHLRLRMMCMFSMGKAAASNEIVEGRSCLYPKRWIGIHGWELSME